MTSSRETQKNRLKIWDIVVCKLDNSGQDEPGGGGGQPTNISHDRVGSVFHDIDRG